MTSRSDSGRGAHGADRLDEMNNYLKDDLRRAHEWMDKVYQPEGKLMSEVARYVYDLRGKMLRPSMVCLFARAHGHDPADDRHTRLAAAMEIFHVATLLHDDVIDNSPTRRGRPTVNARWGNDVAILFADYLYASCFDLALSSLDPEVMRVLTRTTQKMTEGEMFQIEKRGTWLTVDDYLRIISMKTGHLYAACAGLGTLLGGGSRERVLRMMDYGLYYGIAFQITDDTLDYEATGEAWGKPVGGDVAEGKQTLPLVHALQVASPADRAALEATMSDGRDFQTILGYVRKYDGIEVSIAKAGEYSRKAMEFLGDLDPGNEATEHIRALTEGVLVRLS